jgi:5-methylcytosine-specific restriction protein B
MAIDLLAEDYKDLGHSIQFHPNTTYENFIGGLAPDYSDGGGSLRFQPTRGLLMEAAVQAANDPSNNYLLHIDEINRADLGKILGESIFLLEVEKRAEHVQSTPKRKVNLPYDFGNPFNRSFFLPDNLHILGTMNSADRSIAIVDIAVRRRFAFVSLWPRMSVVEKHGCQLMQDAFRSILDIFIEHANEDAFALVPGHSYFLEHDEAKARESLKTNLGPLLQEYLQQGYVGGFSESIRGYVQWLQSL